MLIEDFKGYLIDNRLIYRIEGGFAIIAQCRSHYDDKIYHWKII
ncbi:MAG: type II toxin-antitoxin system YoeB family toxin [Synergistaceae bacterium]|nr:type II toxin-antitoxin system YoeB family toxin [Synergistaceae bacterium]